jgi:hypothetical protein
MAINNITTDYSNRKIDLHIFQGVSAPNASDITPSFGKISNFCTGVQKLVQRYTIALLTELGSQENFPDFGSTLITALTSSSNLYNRVDLYPIFNKANTKVLRDFAAYDRTVSMPVDERLAGARLIEIKSINGGVSMAVQIETYSEDPVTFIIPLPI